MYTHTHTCAWMCACECRCPQRPEVADSLKLQLHVVEATWRGGLRAELRSSVRAARPLNYWALSLWSLLKICLLKRFKIKRTHRWPHTGRSVKTKWDIKKRQGTESHSWWPRLLHVTIWYSCRIKAECSAFQEWNEVPGEISLKIGQCNALD